MWVVCVCVHHVGCVHMCSLSAFQVFTLKLNRLVMCVFTSCFTLRLNHVFVCVHPQTELDIHMCSHRLRQVFTTRLSECSDLFRGLCVFTFTPSHVNPCVRVCSLRLNYVFVGIQRVSRPPPPWGRCPRWMWRPPSCPRESWGSCGGRPSSKSSFSSRWSGKTRAWEVRGQGPSFKVRVNVTVT